MPASLGSAKAWARAAGSLHEAIDRTLAVLAEYRGSPRQHAAEIVAVATEGLRMASDRDRFLAPAPRSSGAESA